MSVGKRTRPLARRRGLPKAGRIKPKKRSASEFQRIYGSKERVAWVKRQPCVATGLTWWDEDRTLGIAHSCGFGMHNMHTETGGVGYKADYTTIVPACGWLHHMAHTLGIKTIQARYSLDLAACAKATEQAWQASQGRTET